MKIESEDNISELIKQEAIRLGFSDCGITRAEYLRDYEELLKSSLEKGYNADKKYLEYNLENRLNPHGLMKDAKTVIVVLAGYKSPEGQNESSYYKISRYAYSKDYHIVLKEKLSALESFIKQKIKGAETKKYVDSSFMLEKALAVKAGLGNTGKNTLFISKRFGSYCFIGEILLNQDIPVDNGVRIESSEFVMCRNCRKCLDACPTNALVGEGILDMRKCISYNTIEDKANNDFTNPTKYIYGCDICQEVCPWNQRNEIDNKFFETDEDILNMRKEDWENLNEQRFEELFKNSAIKRLGFERFKRNIEKIKSGFVQ